MANVTESGDHEEYYAEFIRVEGKRGTLLIFSEGNPFARGLAEDIAKIIDKEEG